MYKETNTDTKFNSFNDLIFFVERAVFPYLLSPWNMLLYLIRNLLISIVVTKISTTFYKLGSLAQYC